MGKKSGKKGRQGRVHKRLPLDSVNDGGCGKLSGSGQQAEPLGTLAPSDLHVPVLLKEVLSFFEPTPGQHILDATLGLGGHAEAMLSKASACGVDTVSLLGLDRDVAALALARERLARFGEKVHAVHAPFSECAEVLAELGWKGIDFALADIGVSSMQIDSADRGFSFNADGPLDMRMDTSSGRNAATMVNEAPVTELRDMIRDFGEDPMAGRIARAIDDARSARRIETTLELARIVEHAYPAKWRAKSRNHPATRTFQALRMAVNDELGELRRFLCDIVPLLNPGGRVAVITFHSLEDRIVKHFFRDEATGCRCPRHVPYCICGHKAALSLVTRKPVVAEPEELSANSRAASAKLRVAEKVHDGD